ncbi:MAG TPA: glycosyltransferase 87 family protein [Candidatus Eisenbacteria bacterium]
MSRHGLLLLLGLLFLAAIAAIPALGDLRVRTGALLALWAVAHAAYLAAARVVTLPAPSGIAPQPGTRPRLAALWIVIVVALLARIVLIPSQPTLSEDVYRYLWDGRLVARGVNPYLHAPDDPSLAPFHDQLLDRINHRHVPTIYPPAAELFFGAVARIEPSPRAFKLAMLPLEAGLWIALLFLLRRRGLADERLLLLAWNPLVVIESYGSGHLDLMAAAFLVLALAMSEAKRAASAGVAFAIAILTKYTPLLLVPYLARKRAVVLLGVAMAVSALFYLPFWDAGGALWKGLATYAEHWEFNGSLYPLLRAAGATLKSSRLILAGALAVAALWISLRARSASGAALGLYTAYLLASPTVYPWYLVPLAALLPLHPNAGLLAFTGLAALSYVPLPTYYATGAWTEPAWIRWIEYGGLAAVATAAVWIGRRREAQARRAAWASETRPT